MSSAWSARRATITRTFAHSFYLLLQAATLIIVIKDDKFIKLCTILERRRTNRVHSEACRGSKLRGDEFRPMAKALDVVLTGDHGAVSARDIGDDEEE